VDRGVAGRRIVVDERTLVLHGADAAAGTGPQSSEGIDERNDRRGERGHARCTRNDDWNHHGSAARPRDRWRVVEQAGVRCRGRVGVSVRPWVQHHIAGREIDIESTEIGVRICYRFSDDLTNQLVAVRRHKCSGGPGVDPVEGLRARRGGELGKDGRRDEQRRRGAVRGRGDDPNVGSDRNDGRKKVQISALHNRDHPRC
jgi:hypothetical protein